MFDPKLYTYGRFARTPFLRTGASPHVWRLLKDDGDHDRSIMLCACHPDTGAVLGSGRILRIRREGFIELYDGVNTTLPLRFIGETRIALQTQIGADPAFV